MNHQLPTANSHFQENPYKTLVIGLDAADWELISVKMAAGKLPHLSALVAHGVSGPLRSIYPLFSPALWTTMATGKRPYEHGITGFTLPNDSGSGLRLYNRNLRRSPAIWNMFSHHKKTSNIVGWWTTAPAEEIQGVVVDETFRIAHRPYYEPWPVSPKSLFPKSIIPLLAQERVHPQQLSEALLRTLIPKLYEIDPSADFRVAAIAKILAEDLTTLQVTLRLMSQKPWDLTALCLMGLDSLAHLAMSYRTPACPKEKKSDCELYGEVVDRAYELYDSWVGQLVEAAGDGVTVIIASDHGFYHDARKPHSLGIEETAPAMQHAPIGTLIMKGPLLHQGIAITHATILDLCPTLLALAGLPIGRDMPGKVLLKAFAHKPTIKRISSWDHSWKATPLLIEPSPEATRAALRQLVSLGYLKEIPSNKKVAIQEAQCDQLFHRALCFLDDERFDQAIPLLEQARITAQQGPCPLSRPDILAELAMAYFRLGEKRRAAAYFYQLVRCRRRDARAALQKLWKKTSTVTHLASTPNFNACVATKTEVTQPFLAQIFHTDGDEEAAKAGGASQNGSLTQHPSVFPDSAVDQYEISGLGSAEFEKKTDLSFAETWEIHHLLARANLNDEGMRFTTTLARFLAHASYDDLLSLVVYSEEHPQDFFAHTYTSLFALEYNMAEKGIAFLHHVATARPEEPTPLAYLATYYCQKDQFAKAEQCARDALERDPLHRPSWLALATALFHQRRWKEACKAAQEAKKSLLQRSKAYTLLADIAREGKGGATSAKRYDALAEKSKFSVTKEIKLFQVFRKKKQQLGGGNSLPSLDPPLSTANTPIIVTGLPRSGTSLVMQMLAAGGIPIDTDHYRQADKHNPRGYFEQEKVKTITSDVNFLKVGSATKVVIPLVSNLSLSGCYSFIWIRRSLAEVIESQGRMAGLTTTASVLESVYRHYEMKTAEYIHHAGWPLLELDYPSLLQYPGQAAQAIADFLKRDLLLEAMAAAVVPSLYRVKLRSPDLAVTTYL